MAASTTKLKLTFALLNPIIFIIQYFNFIRFSRSVCSVQKDLSRFLQQSDFGLDIFELGDKQTELNHLTWSDHFQLLLDRAPSVGNMPNPSNPPLNANGIQIQSEFRLPKNLHQLAYSVQRRIRHSAKYKIKMSASQKQASRIYGVGDWDASKSDFGSGSSNLDQPSGGFRGLVLYAGFESGYLHDSNCEGSDLLGCLTAIARGCLAFFNCPPTQNTSFQGGDHEDEHEHEHEQIWQTLLDLALCSLNLLLTASVVNMRFAVNTER